MTIGSSFDNNLWTWKITLPFENCDTIFVRAVDFEDAIDKIRVNYPDREPNTEGAFGARLTHWDPVLDSYYY
ncbi:hypothetical protein D3C87_835280 [compost metagenome]